MVTLHCLLPKLRHLISLGRKVDHEKLLPLVHCKAVEDYKTGSSSNPSTRGSEMSAV